MTNDFSENSVVVNITNTTNNKIGFDLRDCLQMKLELQPEEVAQIVVLSSEGMAILKRKVAELDLKLEVATIEQDVDIPEISTSLDTIKTDFYNKTENETIEEVDDSVWYTEIGEVLKVTKSITIDGVTFLDTDKPAVSVGKNSNVKVPVFKFDGKVLKVATTYLSAFSEDGLVDIVCGQDEFKITIDDMAGKTLKILNAEGVNTVDGRKNNVTVVGNKITQVSNNGKHIVGVNIAESDNEEAIVDTGLILYRFSPADKSMGMTPVGETYSGKSFTYCTYLKYKNGDYTEADKGVITREVKFVIPTKGSIDLTLELQAEAYTE